MKTELQILLKRWHAKTGETMPLSIQRLSLDKIRTAVSRTEAGEHVFVPASAAAVPVDGGSMVEWDKHGEFT